MDIFSCAYCVLGINLVPLCCSLQAQGGTRFHRMRRRPQTIHEEPRYRYGSSQSKHTIGSRKRPRPDVRDMFPEEEEGERENSVTIELI